MQNKRRDLKGQRFGRLEVLALDHCAKEKDYKLFWLCRCDCGKEKVVNGGSLKEGGVLSCGCLMRENARRRQKELCYKHGKTGTAVFHTWVGMRVRCFDDNDQAFERYGGRGITVDPRWDIFENFYEDMGDPPEGMSLDRIDNNGNYTKDNCRWATRKEQANNRRSCRLIEFEGKILNLKQWAMEKKITYKALHNRIEKQGWSIERSMNEPMRFRHAALEV